METQILHGKTISQDIKVTIKEQVAKCKTKPGLAVVTVGEDPASKVYVKNKEEACKEVGFLWKQIALPETATEEELFSVIDALNVDPEIHGFLVQVPLPEKLKYIEEPLIYRINPKKDVDAFHPYNVGKFMSCRGTSCNSLLLPCTPYGVIRILDEYKIPISGQHIVLLGRSNLVGKPLGLLFLARDATITICHTKTADIREFSKQADILVAAIGKPRMIDASYVKEGAVIVDVGIHWSDTGLVGDVDCDSVKGKVAALTPVPGGVGLMTVAILLENVLKAYHMQSE